MGKGTLVNSDNMGWLNKRPLKEWRVSKVLEAQELLETSEAWELSGNLRSVGTFWKLQKHRNNLWKPQNASASSETPEGHLVGILTLPLKHSRSPMAQTNFQCCSQTNAFVRMSATMSPVETYCMIASPFVTRLSWMWWYFHWICLIWARNCESQDRMMAAWLSQ